MASLLTGHRGSYMLALAAVPLLLWQPILCLWCSAPLICLWSRQAWAGCAWTAAVHHGASCSVMGTVEHGILSVGVSAPLVCLAIPGRRGQVAHVQQLLVMELQALWQALLTVAAWLVFLHPSSAWRLSKPAWAGCSATAGANHGAVCTVERGSQLGFSTPLICWETPGGQVVHGQQLCIIVFAARWCALLSVAARLVLCTPHLLGDPMQAWAGWSTTAAVHYGANAPWWALLRLAAVLSLLVLCTSHLLGAWQAWVELCADSVSSN